MIGKKYVNSSGKINIVKGIFENVTVFEDGSKVDTRILLDPKYYTELPSGNIQRTSTSGQINQNILKQSVTEQIDPNQFFNQRYAITEIAELAPQKNIVDSYTVNDGVTSPFDIEAEKEEILRRNRHLMEQRDIDVAKQANKFKNNETINKILEEEGIKIENTPSPDIYKGENRETSARQIDPVMGQNNNMYVDPMIAVFKKSKMNTDFIFTVEINKKIPKLAYIEMMEESCETSIIDYLASEFTESILRNPSIIKDKIAEEIRRMIDEPNKQKAKTEIKNVKKEIVSNKLAPKTKTKVIPEPPTPPIDRILIEGQKPQKP